MARRTSASIASRATLAQLAAVLWTNRDLAHNEITAMLPSTAAANAGGNIYMRLGPGVRDNHPGIAMIDDLPESAIRQLSRDDLDPSRVVETSPGNYQAWIRLIGSGAIPYSTMGLEWPDVSPRPMAAMSVLSLRGPNAALGGLHDRQSGSGHHRPYRRHLRAAKDPDSKGSNP